MSNYTYLHQESINDSKLDRNYTKNIKYGLSNTTLNSYSFCDTNSFYVFNNKEQNKYNTTFYSGNRFK